MATITGSTASSLWTFKLVTTESAANIENNTSPLKVDVYIGRSSSAGSSYMWGASISCPINVTGCAQQTLSYSNSGRVDVAGGGWLHLGSKTFTVPHDSNGSKTVTVSASFTNNVSPASGSASGSVVLATIPRATTPVLSATSVTMGNQMTITLTPADSSFKHKLRYSFGSLESQVAGFSEGNNFTPAGTRSVSFTPPTSLGGEIPNTTSGTCTIYCYTYTSSGAHIGTVSKTVTLSVPAYTVQVNLALTGNNLLNGEYVQDKSTISVVVMASTSYGAKIKSYSTSVDGKTYTDSTFTTSTLSAGSKTVTTIITDTRGKNIVTNTTPIVVHEYFSPQITSFTLERQSDGTTVVASIKGKIASVNNKNGRNVHITLNGVTKSYTSASYVIDGSLTFTGVPTDSTLPATAALYDYFTDTKREAILPTVAVTMDFHHSGKGVAFGKVAEHEGLLDVAWPIKSCSIPNLLGGYGTPIPSGADLNTAAYLGVGNYSCSTTSVAASLSNCPATMAFNMTVSNMFNTATNPAPTDWVYLVREITDLYGSKYFQLAWSNPTSGWIFEPWFAALDTLKVKDYVIEQGRYDAEWEYTKWNSGKIELWGDVTVTFPAPTQQTDYLWRSIVSIDMRNELTKIISGNCPMQYSGLTPQVCRNMSQPTTAEIVIATSRTFEAFTTTVPIYIIGRWK